MTLLRRLRKTPMTLGCLLMALSSARGLGVTQFSENRRPFIRDLSSLHSDLMLPIRASTETLTIPSDLLHERAEMAPVRETVEPLTIVLEPSDEGVDQMVDKLAKNGKEEALRQYLKKAVADAKPIRANGTGPRSVEIDVEALDLVDHDALAQVFSRTHHRLVVDGAELRRSKKLRQKLLKEISPFMSLAEKNKIKSSILKGDPLEVDLLLLPEFARKTVGRYVPYRGPNCFHAALAFQSPRLTRSSLVNVKEEKGYHRAMINYDELWRILTRNFYEIPAQEASLRYGDMLVFFDVPRQVSDQDRLAIDFRWIRHTATYLFNGYTFSKGSKSSNTPYSVRTLEEEWNTWKSYTKNLGVKVFRRSAKRPPGRPAFDATDWIY